MRVSVCLGAILIPEYLDFHSGGSRNIFLNIFLNERAHRVVHFDKGFQQNDELFSVCLMLSQRHAWILIRVCCPDFTLSLAKFS